MPLVRRKCPTTDSLLCSNYSSQLASITAKGKKADMTLELNEITLLMAVNAALMISLMGMFIHLSVTTILAGNKAPDGPEHFRRS
jgi:hypothetical protein